MQPEDTVALAIEVAAEGLAAGEMPIGAVVLLGDDVVATASTGERRLGRRIVHADLLAMTAADECLGWSRRQAPLTLAVTLEPCLMCLGAAITLRVDRVHYGLESPDDGGVELLAQWRPAHELPFFRPPAEISGGHHRAAVRAQLATYAARPDAPPGMREWCRGLSVE